MGPQQGPVGYQGHKRSNGTQSGPKQYAVEADAALAVLQEQFPLYNQDSLTDVLKVRRVSDREPVLVDLMMAVQPYCKCTLLLVIGTALLGTSNCAK